MGVALTEARDGICAIDTLLLSCRVIGRGIETALIAFLADQARLAGRARLQGSFIPTKKNLPARDVYRQAGLAPAGTIEGGELWELDLASVTVESPSWIAR